MKKFLRSYEVKQWRLLSRVLLCAVVLVAMAAGIVYSQQNGQSVPGGGAVAVQGVNGTTAHTLLTDSLGNLLVESSAANVSPASMETTSTTLVSRWNSSTQSTGALGVETFGIDPCMASGVPKTSAAINITSATTTSLAAVSGTKAIYVCGGSVTIAPSATSADTFQLEYGTGAACVTTQSVQTGTYGNGDLTSAAPVVAVNIPEIGPSAASSALCAVTAGTAVSVQGVITYVQQ